MKYLCLIYDDEKRMATMSKDEGDAFMGEYFAFTEGIKKSGYYLIEARDLNDALQVAAKIPSIRTGSIEVRPIEEFS